MRSAAFVLVVVAGMLAARGDTRADDDAGSGARRLRVVARVGPRAITVGDLEDRVADMPPFQRPSFGATRDVIRRRFLTEVILRDVLLSLGAESQRVGDRPPAAYQIERARSGATIRAIRARVGPASAIPWEDVKAYYDENRDRYNAPERYQLWRILCKTRDEAQAVLDAAKRDSTPLVFGALAREHSLDKATNLRAGNLGFVQADGSSNEPGLRIAPSVVGAAQSVRDGELVPAPVAEGEYFAVVWRRGTIAAANRSVSDVAAQIRDTLWKRRVKEQTDELVASLRAAKLRDLNPRLLDSIELSVDVGLRPADLGPSTDAGASRP
jgi:peptidyl-prolyl cis-trans isomerase C